MNKAMEQQLRDALKWCSGSDDFQVGGKAREGWEKICIPLLQAGPVEQTLAMKMALGETGLKLSHQGEFPLKATCICGGEGRIAFVVYERPGVEGASYIYDMHKNEPGNMWVHDAIAVAVYLCRKCLKPIAICNQG